MCPLQWWLQLATQSSSLGDNAHLPTQYQAQQSSLFAVVTLHPSATRTA
jgi:hypothetical protein